ncbi:MAG: hypothetical protein VB980_04480 [Opitutales bacterium]|jgi:hypothetical protein
MKRFFERLSGREQGLFLLLIWSGILFWGTSSLAQLIEGYRTYDMHATAIGNHNLILRNRPITEGKINKHLKSHDTRITRTILENSAYGEARSIHKGGVWMPKQTKERPLGEFFQQHTVVIEFKQATWDHLEEYVNKVKDRKHMFLSEVKIKPSYLSQNGPVKDYNAVFSVSALELIKRF